MPVEPPWHSPLGGFLELQPAFERDFHFANDAIHRDGGPECDQPGTPRRVYVFDPDYLSVHEAKVAEWAAGQLTATLRARVRELYEEADADGYMDALPPLHQVMLALGAPEDWAEPGGQP